MEELVDLGIAFLMAGSVYSDVPYPDVDKVRTKNRLLGLGLMGLHEWLVTHGKKYGPDPELEKYLEIYTTSGTVANRWAKEWRLSKPKRTRALAPNGTTSIVSGTTGGCEPIFCVAYKRRYYKGTIVHYEYVIDPVAKRLIDTGVSPDTIEDAYSLAEDPERRVVFQEWLQKYVDNAIASTVNLPPWGSATNNDSTVRPFGEMLIKHLPNLRGITMYPDGARSGQPLTVVNYHTAVSKVGAVFTEEQADVCSITNRGSCGA
jgi:ribonucleoside-diphosphate reductase alpha chain